MSSTGVAALIACVCTAPVIGDAQAPARQPPVTTDVVYGHKDGLALTLDVHRPAQPNGAGLISIVSGGWRSSVEMARMFTHAYPPLNEKGFTFFAVRHGSWPRYPLSSWERREVEPSRAQFHHQRHERRRAAYKSHFELGRN